MPDWVKEVRERLAREADLPPVPLGVVEEVAQHIADVHRDAIFKGNSQDEADALVARELSQVRDLSVAIAARRRQKGTMESRAWMLAGMKRDLVHSWRLMATKRAYSTVVILTLAVGVGVCTAVFSLFNSLLLAPLPYPDPGRLVLLWETDADDRNASFIVSAPNYLDWSRETLAFSAMGMWEYRTYNVAADAEPEQVAGIRATASLFDVLGVPPALGRTFTPREDDQRQPVVVISDVIWQTHFAADRTAIGRSMRLNGEVYQVIGVMPPGFEFPRKGTGIWTPMALLPQDMERDSHSFFVAGRLRPDVTFEQGRDEVERLGAAMRQKYTENARSSATVQPMHEYGIVGVNRILRALAGAVGLVFLMVCVNVASLQFGLGLARRREFATRLSLGATRRVLARQVFVESLLISGIGAVGGVIVAWTVTRFVDVILSPGFRDLPLRGEVAIVLDARVLLFAVASSVMAALLFAFTPLVSIKRLSLQSALRDSERGATRLAAKTRWVLVAAEIGLALVVLSGADLMVRSLAALLNVSPGLDPGNVLTMRVSLPQADTYGPPERATFCADLDREVSAVPGVIRASAISHLPLSGMNAGRGFTIEGRPEPADNQNASASYRLVCPGYFAALGIALTAGRDFTQQDLQNSEPVLIVNRATAQHYWPDANPLGQRIKLGGYASRNPWMTIVGVAENVRHFGLETSAPREIYRPYTQAAWPLMTVVAKTLGEPLSVERSVRAALKRVELDLPAAAPRSMEEVVSLSVAWRKTPMRLLSGFAVIGLVLAGIGVYGVLAYYVSQRTREFGVRVALGASKLKLICLVLRQSAVPIAIGVAAGLAGSLASGQLLSNLLYEVKPWDAIVIASISALLIAVALVASWVPARRAAMIDPVIALRDE